MLSTGEAVESGKPLFTWRRFGEAMKWGFMDLGFSVSKYIFYGIAIAALIFVLIPHWFIAKYLGDPGLLSYGGSVTLGAVMYVCSVGHIPVVAALMAMGANPGVAMSFLLSGVATNLPELIAISRLLRPKVALIYSGGLIGVAVLVGVLVNTVLTDFKPVYAVDENSTVISIAKSINIVMPGFISEFCAMVILVVGVWSAGFSLYKRFAGVKE